MCLRDESGFGACRLPQESSCGGGEDCPRGTACVGGECTNECSVDGDCAPGSRCQDGGCAPIEQRCAVDLDCGEGVCIAGACVDECRSDRDCRFGGRCVAARCMPLDGSVRVDAAPPDAAMPDAGTLTPLTGVSAIAAGEGFSCAVSEGDLHCWGRLPPLGSPAPLDDPIERPVCGPLREGAVEAVDASHHHYCALEGGMLFCAGDNRAGELGDGSTEKRSELVEASLSPVSAVSTGGDLLGLGHTCAISAGEVFCWGGNFSGELGNGTTVGSPTPVSTGFVGAELVAAGFDFSCAVNAAGELWCWGGGAPSPANGMNVPTQVPVTSRPVSLSLSNIPALGTVGCFVDVMQRAFCWTRAGSLTQVVSADRFTSVAVGSEHFCFLRADSTVTCFGRNREGQLGIGSNQESSPIGMNVVTESGPLTRVVALAAGARHSCASTDTGEMWCWGANLEGQLGANGRTPSNVARQVLCLR
ncbi:MAG: hypothetical protein AAGE52_23680 [Myxococcota bacterium]